MHPPSSLSVLLAYRYLVTHIIYQAGPITYLMVDNKLCYGDSEVSQETQKDDDKDQKDAQYYATEIIH